VRAGEEDEPDTSGTDGNEPACGLSFSGRSEGVYLLVEWGESAIQ
jgi:hypothetical protein